LHLPSIRRNDRNDERRPGAIRRAGNNTWTTMSAGDHGGEREIEAIIEIAGQLAADDVRDGYTHIGPATSGAFRFKWTARLQADGRYVVDETVGSGTVAVKSRPMSRDEVLPFIESRHRRIQAKVDEVKRELAGIQGIAVDEPQASDRGGDPQRMYDEIRRLLKEGK
jgi:hypothetical protein